MVIFHRLHFANPYFHKPFFHTLNVLFSIVLYVLCVLNADFFVAYGPSVTTAVPKHFGLTTLWVLYI